jgi:hypothetical protein
VNLAEILRPTSISIGVVPSPAPTFVLGAHLLALLLTLKIPAQNARAVGPYPMGRWSLHAPAGVHTVHLVSGKTDCGMTRTVPDRKVILDAVTLACRAPSLHNSQPWRWKNVDGAALYLFAEKTQLGPCETS